MVAATPVQHDPAVAGADPSAAQAASVWNAAVDLPYRIAGRVVVFVAPLGVIPLAAIKFATGMSTSAVAAGYLPGVVAMLAALVPIVFGYELALRPLLEDAAAFLASDFVPATRGWRLRTKAVAALPSVALFSALTVGAFVNVARRPERDPRCTHPT
jgi:hypothetical protein